MRRHAVVAALLTLSLVLSGCGAVGFPGLHTVPLPGGADVGEHPYRVKVHFANVLNLVPQASVKVNDVAVGKVTDIRLSGDNATAVVTVLVNGDVRLPANAVARLRQSSLLGAKFVALGEPSEPRGRLADGAVIPVTRTNRNPEIEEVLGALSLLLNGGGIGRVRTIVEEVNKALSGNEAQIRSLLGNLNETITMLDRQKDDITRAIDGLNRLSAKLRSQTGRITTALEHLEPGIEVVNRQRDELVTMMRSLNELSDVAVRTVNRSRADLIANLRALAPTLRKLAEAGESLPKAISYLATYPFPKYAMEPLKGDYVNTSVKFDLSVNNIVKSVLKEFERPAQSGPSEPKKPATPSLPLPLPGPADVPEKQGERTPQPEKKPKNPTGDESDGLLGGLLGGL